MSSSGYKIDWMISSDSHIVEPPDLWTESIEDSTFPRSRVITAEILADVPVEEQCMILRDNAATLYGFDVACLKSTAEGAPLRR